MSKEIIKSSAKVNCAGYQREEESTSTTCDCSAEGRALIAQKSSGVLPGAGDGNCSFVGMHCSITHRLSLLLSSSLLYCLLLVGSESGFQFALFARALPALSVFASTRRAVCWR